MKIRVLVPVLLAVIILGLGYELSPAQSQIEKSSSKIGVVNFDKVFRSCKRGVAYQDQMKAEQDKIMAELTKLKEAADLDQEGLTRLKAGSEDYNKLLKEMLTKQASLEAQKQYQKQRLEAKDQEWTKNVYNDFLLAVGKVAQSKGLEMVVEKRDIDPLMAVNEIMMSTRPVFYSGGCVDISAEILAELDANAK
jgi:Skp family chaperone for outer membrane proteins